MKSSTEIRNFYNDYAAKQIRTGVNLRHLSLMNTLIRKGLKKRHTVLEIGCGIGTLTGLLHHYVKKGKVVATDISSDSVMIAKNRIKNSASIDFYVTDMSDFSYPQKFDFVVLPDVLEHIPVDQHIDLFKTISRHMHDNSIIVINIPHPKSIEYYQQYHPEKLQIIDQALSADRLLHDAYASELLLIEYRSYSIFHSGHDYALVVLRKNLPMTFSERPKHKVIVEKTINRIKLLWASV